MIHTYINAYLNIFKVSHLLWFICVWLDHSVIVDF